ncbi:MAG: hypothetical protein Q8881_03005 [Sweet potato little leaf phytoplasma]|nr:hypothetical protein [Sweet potato little leaf phytoplasma]
MPSGTFPTKWTNFCRILHSGRFRRNGRINPAEFCTGDDSDETAEFRTRVVSPETAESIPPNFKLGTFPLKLLNQYHRISAELPLEDVSDEAAEFPPNFALGDVSPEMAEFLPNFAVKDVSNETAESILPNFALGTIPTKQPNFRQISPFGTFPTKWPNFCRISQSGTFPTKPPNQSRRISHWDDSNEIAEFPPNFALGDVSPKTAESIPPNFRRISHPGRFR